MENRKTPLISKRKLITAINLFEKKIDETVEHITIVTSTLYRIKGKGYYEYFVDIKNNKVTRIYPDFD